MLHHVRTTHNVDGECDYFPMRCMLWTYPFANSPLQQFSWFIRTDVDNPYKCLHDLVIIQVLRNAEGVFVSGYFSVTKMYGSTLLRYEGVGRVNFQKKNLA